jgi:hypothetical protein
VIDALRGAMPTAECPRCSETSAPTETRLVTCVRCGLVFTPHELQHPHRAPSVPDPPPGLTVTRTDDATIARWPLPRIYGVFIVLLTLPLIYGACMIDSAAGLVLGIPALLLGYLAAILLVNHVDVVITRDVLIRRYRPLRLLDSRTISRAGLGDVRFAFEQAVRNQRARYLIEVGRPGAPYELLAVTTRGDHARYLRDLLAQVCDLVPR